MASGGSPYKWPHVKSSHWKANDIYLQNHTVQIELKKHSAFKVITIESLYWCFFYRLLSRTWRCHGDMVLHRNEIPGNCIHGDCLCLGNHWINHCRVYNHRVNNHRIHNSGVSHCILTAWASRKRNIGPWLVKPVMLRKLQYSDAANGWFLTQLAPNIQPKSFSFVCTFTSMISQDTSNKLTPKPQG